MYVTNKAGWAKLLAVPVALTMMAAGPALPTPPKLSMATRLLATSVVAPTQIPGFLEIHGQDLINVLMPYIAATYGTPSQPIGEISYPASSATNSISIGVAGLQAATTGDPAPVMAGISQGAVVISVFKKQFNAQYAGADPATIPTPTFVLIGNPSRPNGGLSERFAGLGIPAIGGTGSDTIPTPTETAGAAPGQVTTYDFARQYDFFADFPNRPLDLFATVNALFGAVLAHGSYGALTAGNGALGAIIAKDPYGTVGPSDAIFQDQVGDTAYYLIPSPVLPMLQPLAYLGVPAPIIAALDAPLRVLVEAGYDRTISPGQPTQAQLLPAANLGLTLVNFLKAIPTGLDNAFQMMGLGRPFRTTPAGPYGVGGPPVTLTQSTAATPLAMSPAGTVASPVAAVADTDSATLKRITAKTLKAGAGDAGVTQDSRPARDESPADHQSKKGLGGRGHEGTSEISETSETSGTSGSSTKSTARASRSTAPASKSTHTRPGKQHHS